MTEIEHQKQTVQLSFLYSVPKEVHDMAKIKFPCNATPDTPTFTGIFSHYYLSNYIALLQLFMAGIPPHVLLLSEMQSMKDEFRKMVERLLADFKKILDERNFGGIEFLNMITLMETIDVIGDKNLMMIDNRVSKEPDFG